MRRGFAIALWCLTGVAGGVSWAGEPHARPTLVPERASVAPGETVWVAVDFELDEGWHMYWPGINDTGIALDAVIECSGEAEVGELVWPAPHRYLSPGDILDHVFEEWMTVLLPVTVAGDASADSSVTITMDMRWLVCESACVMESAEREITIPITGKTAAPSPDAAAVFARVRSRIPKPITDRDAVRLAVADSRFVFESDGAAAMAFYPLVESREPMDLLNEGQADGDHLSIEFRGGDAPIAGVLEVWSSADESALYAVSWPPLRRGARPHTGAETDRPTDE